VWHWGATAPIAMGTDTERELVRRMLAGDKQAFAALYDRYAPRILGLASKMLSDRSAAEDATQETFLLLWQKAHVYSADKGALLTWLYRICRNICLDRLRRRQRQREVVLDPLTEAEYAVPGVDSGEQWELWVNQALSSLGEGERELLEQAFFHGLSHRQIAEQTKLPLGTVKTRIAAALKKLRHELAAFKQGSRDT